MTVTRQTERAKTTVHPETLAYLQEQMPFLGSLLAFTKGLDLEGGEQEAIDEFRQKFPGLDDLTLAAMLADRAACDFAVALDYDDNPTGTGLAVNAIGYAILALELAKEIR